jgi:hypothetical protein
MSQRMRYLQDICKKCIIIVHPLIGLSLSHDCVTISMGFRAPSYESLMTAFSQHVIVARNSSIHYYNDPSLSDLLPMRDDNHYDTGLLDNATIGRLRGAMSAELNSGFHQGFTKWLGKYLTTPLRMRANKPFPFFLKEGVQYLSLLQRTEEEMDENEAEDEDGDYELPLALCKPYSVAADRVYHCIEDLFEDFFSRKVFHFFPGEWGPLFFL